MIDTGCALESQAIRSSVAAIGARTTTQACSISTTTGPTTTTTMSASADPTLQRLDAGHAATEGSILVESIPQVTAKARRQLNQTSAKPETAAAPMGAVVGCGKMGKLPQAGDIIREYKHFLDLIVKKAYPRDGGVGFVVVPYNPLNNPHYGKEDLFIHSYELVGEFCRSLYPHAEGTTGYSMNHGGMNGDGYDYLEIVERSAQGSLF